MLEEVRLATQVAKHKIEVDAAAENLPGCDRGIETPGKQSDTATLYGEWQSCGTRDLAFDPKHALALELQGDSHLGISEIDSRCEGPQCIAQRMLDSSRRYRGQLARAHPTGPDREALAPDTVAKTPDSLGDDVLEPRSRRRFRQCRRLDPEATRHGLESRRRPRVDVEALASPLYGGAAAGAFQGAPQVVEQTLLKASSGGAGLGRQFA